MITREQYIRIKDKITRKIETLQSSQAEKQKQIDQLQELSDALCVYTAEAKKSEIAAKLTREMRAIFIDSIYIYDRKHIEVKFAFEDVI